MNDRDNMSYCVQTEEGITEIGGAEATIVLVVDDYRTIAEMTAAMLRSQGYRVIIATSGEEAQVLAEESPRIDLLLTDIEMPHMRGDELAAWFRAVRAETRILLMSSQRSAHALPFLRKPFGLETLIGKVHEVLNHQSNSENADA
jgi:two-component system, cell cycle sensor histidine kinase and response regulator CckA